MQALITFSLLSYIIIKEKPISRYITSFPKLSNSIEKNSASGFYQVVKLDTNLKLGSKVKKNDIITFYSTNSYFGDTPITHRILKVDKSNGLEFTVKGDNNQREDNDKVKSENVIGKVILIIPSLGKLQFFLASQKGFVFAIIVPALIIITYDIYKIINAIILKSKLSKLKNKNGNI